ncbi:MAG: aldehyde ferredoxin oxidoreductase family protein [Lachnospiraceae bacterium]|nr:aldehyde ferredoxin oxidoreductase family protein [Lachnospiraceae bacterium]
MNGYWKKLCRVNLTDKTWTTEDIDEATLDLLMGGTALGAKILLEETEPNVDPLSPENKIIFAVGCLQACPTFPGNAKWSVITKSPLTGSVTDSAGTGAWAPQFKKCGYEALVIEGKADKPTWLYITDDGVEFRNAEELWGLDSIDTSAKIKEILGDKRVNALNIGPAGEIMNPIANITCDGHSFAGRGGTGAVMGSKNLKAIAAWGTKQCEVADLEAAKAFGKEVFVNLHKATESAEGTPSVMVGMEAIGDSPIRYWRGDVWHKGAETIGTPRYTQFYNVKPLPCQNCPIGCHRHIDFELSNGERMVGNGPEYETLGTMGSGLCIDDLEAIALANDMANRAGVDTISLGSYVGFLIECYESALITAEEIGMVPKFGDKETLLFLCDKLIKNEGVGKLFVKGIRGAAAAIGGDAQDLTVEVKNMDLPAHDPRAVFANFPNYATGARGACHERGDTQAIATGLVYPEVGLEETPDRFSVEQAPNIAIIAQDGALMYNCLTICKFMIKFAGMTISELAHELELILGKEVDPYELFKVGERSQNLQRLINVRDGMSRKDDTAPKKLFLPAATGSRAFKAPTQAEFDWMLDEYYKQRGWDNNGIPTAERLEELGLGDYVKYLP